MELYEDQIISAPFLREKARILKFEAKRGYYLLKLVYLQSGVYDSFQILQNQLAQVQVLGEERFEGAQESQDFFFWIEANRLRLAYQYDPILAVNISQIEPLPHQIEAVYDYVLRDPKVRFLIADDAGAGKTIMAGLAIKELQYRNLAERILIVTPGHLKYQWQREMKEKFKTRFRLLTRSTLDETWGANVWEELNHIIASIDFLKQDNVLEKLQTSKWDLVVVDEAHKMSARGKPTKKGYQVDKTKRYILGETLSRISTHLLFLSATPHQGDEERFKLFLDLLRPGFFARVELLKESIESNENPIFIRRLKEDMRTFEGRKIFPPRHVKTVFFQLTAAERELYESVTKYVRFYYNRAKERRSISFAMLMLQRRLASSMHAIFRSLENRKSRLLKSMKQISQTKKPREVNPWESFSEENLVEFEDMTEEERWELEEKLEGVTLARTSMELKEELSHVETLLDHARRVREAEIESKLNKLRHEILAALGTRKLLIFTEFRDTLYYLVEKIRGWGYKVNTIHGYMKMEERIAAEKDFYHDTQIMVATEAAGEGINLQFCSWMVNYDIPWNPTRLEQRMGRIHRYGQDKEVYIFNMVTRDTREGLVLDRLFGKLRAMQEALGSDRVFDIIGDLIPGKNLKDVLEEAVFGQKRIEDIYGSVDAIDQEETENIIQRISMSSLATRHIDDTKLRRLSQESEENRLMPEYIEDYFQRALKRLGGESKPIGNHISVTKVPPALIRFNSDPRFYSKYGKISRKYTRLSFYKEKASQFSDIEYIAPGHELLEAINEKILETLWSSENLAFFIDETNEKTGVLWFVTGEVKDGLGNTAGKRLYCLFQDLQTEIHKVSPSILWDLTPGKFEVDQPIRELIENTEDVMEYSTTEIFFPYRNEILKRRETMCNIKEKYGLRSLDFLLQESVNKIVKYQFQQAEGQDMRLALMNEERRRGELEERRKQLDTEIRSERNLTVSPPVINGCAVVLPSDQVTGSKIGISPDMVTSEDIERVGMVVSMTYETDQGWEVEDVHLENLGFDLRSRKLNEDGTQEVFRYIEVKARAKAGNIRLTANEWKKAKRFKDKFWLYIVTFSSTESPKLNRIQNPFDSFILDEDIYATGYIIPEEKWKE